MTPKTLDRIGKTRVYKSLVAQFPPRPIRSAEQCRAAHHVIDRLMGLESPSADQLEFLELLSRLVENYEAIEHPTTSLPTKDLLAFLMESKGVSQVQVAAATKIATSTI